MSGMSDCAAYDAAVTADAIPNAVAYATTGLPVNTVPVVPVNRVISKPCNAGDVRGLLVAEYKMRCLSWFDMPNKPRSISSRRSLFSSHASMEL